MKNLKRFRNTEYYMSDGGLIYSNKFGKVKRLKPHMNSRTGYDSITYYEYGKHTVLLHRMIAECFLPDYSEELQVNHIDGNKINNKLSNLEMMDCKSNISHYKGEYLEYRLIDKKRNSTHIFSTYRDIQKFIGYKSCGTICNLMKEENSKWRIEKIVKKVY